MRSASWILSLWKSQSFRWSVRSQEKKCCVKTLSCPWKQLCNQPLRHLSHIWISKTLSMQMLGCGLRSFCPPSLLSNILGVFVRDWLLIHNFPDPLLWIQNYLKQKWHESSSFMGDTSMKVVVRYLAWNDWVQHPRWDRAHKKVVNGLVWVGPSWTG